MSKTVEIRYIEDQAQYRAEFFKGAKLFESKALTNDEAEAVSLVFGLPGVSELVRLQADFLVESLDELGGVDDSNLMLILHDLVR